MKASTRVDYHGYGESFGTVTGRTREISCSAKGGGGNSGYSHGRLVKVTEYEVRWDEDGRLDWHRKEELRRAKKGM